MSIRVAQSAGFCFGVKRAVEALERVAKNLPAGGTVSTLGPLIHNEGYVRSQEERGIFAIDEVEAIKRAEQASAAHSFALIIRAHGILLETEEKLREIAAKNPHFTMVDCTCPFVQKVQKIALSINPKEKFFLLLGDKDHPEVKGVMRPFSTEWR